MHITTQYTYAGIRITTLVMISMVAAQNVDIGMEKIWFLTAPLTNCMKTK